MDCVQTGLLAPWARSHEARYLDGLDQQTADRHHYGGRIGRRAARPCARVVCFQHQHGATNCCPRTMATFTVGARRFESLQYNTDSSSRATIRSTNFIADCSAQFSAAEFVAAKFQKATEPKSSRRSVETDQSQPST